MTRVFRIHNRNTAATVVNQGGGNPNPGNPTNPANPTNPPNPPNPPNPTNPAGQPPCNNRWFNLTPSDLRRLLTAIAAAILTFFLSFVLLHFWLAPNWSTWVVALLSFLFATIILAAFDAAFITKSGLGKSIIFFLILLTGFTIIGTCSSSKKDKAEKTETAKAAEQEIVAPEITEYNTPGTYPINLAEGQESKWIKIGPRRNYSFSNNKATFILKFRDGTIANSWDPGQWPDKFEFKVYNLSREQFDLIIN